MIVSTLTVFFLCFSTHVHAFSSGAPSSACSSITPGHGGSSGAIPGGFFLYSNLIDNGGQYTSNTVYTSKKPKLCLTFI